MRARRGTTALLLVAAVLAAGGRCGGGRGTGGGGVSVRIESPDGRCAALPSLFPPGFDFLPGGAGAIVADLASPSLVPFAIDRTPPQIAAIPPITPVPADSDGDGRDEGVGPVPFVPILNDVRVVAPDLGLATASSYEEVLFFRPEQGGLREVRIEVPASFAAADNPFLPSPGSGGLRTGLSTFACVRPDPGALDSRGDPIATSLPPAGFCDAATPSYYATFTSGAAVAGGHLFVSMSNLGNDQGTAQTQYLPGAVLVYDLALDQDPPVVRPNELAPVLVTTAFNPTHVTPYRVGTRDFVLVSASGAIGIDRDDPLTDPIEGGALALSESAIDVIDAHSLELVATIPLGLGALSFDRLAIDPSGRVAVAGSAAGRVLYAVDLAPLATLPSRVVTPIVLDGGDGPDRGPDAVIFDAAVPLAVPPVPFGAPARSCPGFTVGTAFNHAGDVVYATEFCDGTLARFSVDLLGAPAVPVPASRFSLLEVSALVAPLRPDTLGLPRGPGSLAVRPGEPGVDFSGPELFVLISEPEGLFCGIRVE